MIFNEETCKLIKLIEENYLKVWKTHSVKQFMGENISKELLIKLVDDMTDAYENILQGEMQRLKAELKKDFRKKLGIIEQ